MKQVTIVLLDDDPIDCIKVEIMISEFISNDMTFKLIAVFRELDALLIYLQTHIVDIIISEIFTDKKTAGIELLKKLKYNHTPIILVSQSIEKGIFVEAKKYRKFYYLIKPFHHLTLQSTIENILAENIKEKTYNSLDKQYLFLKGRLNNIDKILFEEILFLEADGNYCFIHSTNKKYVIKKSLSKLLTEELNGSFIRIHHKYAINKQHILIIRDRTLQILGRIDLPIGKTFKKNISNLLK
jgi:DNA-binding LytR/AlgR family response regulator